MKVIATLSPSVRLVVIQFLMKSAQVPAIIPPKRLSDTPPPVAVRGVEVLPSTPGVYLLPLIDGVCPITDDGPYVLVDAWKKSHETKWNMSFVRFVLCHKEHVKPDELFPDFVAKRDELIETLVHLVDDNLWATQGHLNLYFEDGVPTGHSVLMFGCAGRVPTVDSIGNTFKVFRDGRDRLGQGLGPKVPMSNRAPHLKVANDNVFLDVVAASEPVPAPVG